MRKRIENKTLRSQVRALKIAKKIRDALHAQGLTGAEFNQRYREDVSRALYADNQRRSVISLSEIKCSSIEVEMEWDKYVRNQCKKLNKI